MNNEIILNSNDDNTISFNLSINEQIFDKCDVRLVISIADSINLSIVCEKVNNEYHALIPLKYIKLFNNNIEYCIEVIFNNYYFKPLTGVFTLNSNIDIKATLNNINQTLSTDEQNDSLNITNNVVDIDNISSADTESSNQITRTQSIDEAVHSILAELGFNTKNKSNTLKNKNKGKYKLVNYSNK